MSARGSDEEAFLDLVRSDGGAFARLAAAYEADPGRREELFQEIVFAIWTAIPRFRGDASLRTFAFRIAHNQGIRHASRAAAAKTARLADSPPLVDPAVDPESGVEARQRAERLHAAVRRLPLVQREAIVLQLEGLSAGEIAEVLGTSENGVLIRLSRARKRLREILEKG